MQGMSFDSRRKGSLGAGNCLRANIVRAIFNQPYKTVSEATHSDETVQGGERQRDEQPVCIQRGANDCRCVGLGRYPVSPVGAVSDGQITTTSTFRFRKMHTRRLEYARASVTCRPTYRYVNPKHPRCYTHPIVCCALKRVASYIPLWLVCQGTPMQFAGPLVSYTILCAFRSFGWGACHAVAWSYTNSRPDHIAANRRQLRPSQERNRDSRCLCNTTSQFCGSRPIRFRRIGSSSADQARNSALNHLSCNWQRTNAQPKPEGPDNELVTLHQLAWRDYS